MRFVAFLVKVAACLPIAVMAWADESVLKLAPGATATVQLDENASTGFSWSIDKARSVNLELVAIEDGGSVSTRPNAPGEPPIVGAPQQRSWNVRALNPGHARIVWIYQRPWENSSVNEHSVTVEISAR